jgi:hypothetical protein
VGAQSWDVITALGSDQPRVRRTLVAVVDSGVDGTKAGLTDLKDPNNARKVSRTGTATGAGGNAAARRSVAGACRQVAARGWRWLDSSAVEGPVAALAVEPAPGEVRIPQRAQHISMPGAGEHVD